MPAGTIALTNGSKTVTGTGTSFTTELKAGDFVYVTVGGAPYTLVASAVTSNTQLALAVAFDGPTTSGLAWNAVPASLQVAITQKILNDFASVARGRILDFANWQKIYSTDQSITVTRPDRSTFTGPSWGYMASQYANKVDKTALDSYLLKSDNLGSLTDKVAARTNLGFVDGALPITLGGTGAKTKADAWKALATFGTAAGTAAQGNDARLDTVDGKSSGAVNGATLSVRDNPQNTAFRSSSTNAWQETPGIFRNILAEAATSSTQFSQIDFIVNNNTGRASVRLIPYASGSAYYVFTADHTGESTARVFTPTSDENLKENIKRVENPLEKMRLIRGVTFTYIDGGYAGIGFTAQDAEKAFPEHVTTTPGKITLSNGKVLKEVKRPDTYGIAAALHHEAILTLMDKLDEKDAVIAELQKRMKAIDGLDA